MAKKDIGPATTILDARLERLEGESKNYTKFGSLTQQAHLGNKPQILLGNDGKVYIDKQLVNGAKAITITVTVEK